MTEARISHEQASMFERAVIAGGVVVFPSDTVYGLACAADDAVAFDRLYALKGRVADKPSAIMFFQLDQALAALPDLGPRTQNGVATLLPGPATLLLPNPARRYPLACAGDPSTLGLRVPALPPALQTLETMRVPVLQSSANRAGDPEASVLADVPQEIRDRADVVLDGGELPGEPSTVIDLRRFENAAEWSIVRQGALTADRIRDALG